MPQSQKSARDIRHRAAPGACGALHLGMQAIASGLAVSDSWGWPAVLEMRRRESSLRVDVGSRGDALAASVCGSISLTTPPLCSSSPGTPVTLMPQTPCCAGAPSDQLRTGTPNASGRPFVNVCGIGLPFLLHAIRWPRGNRGNRSGRPRETPTDAELRRRYASAPFDVSAPYPAGTNHPTALTALKERARHARRSARLALCASTCRASRPRNDRETPDYASLI